MQKDSVKPDFILILIFRHSTEWIASTVVISMFLMSFFIVGPVGTNQPTALDIVTRCRYEKMHMVIIFAMHLSISNFVDCMVLYEDII